MKETGSETINSIDLVKQYIATLFILWTTGATALQAQRKEPIVNDCEARIRMLKKAPDDRTFADALYLLGRYCRDKGMYQEATLLTFLAVPLVDNNNAHYEYAKTMTLAGESMAHLSYLRPSVEKMYEAAISHYKSSHKDGMYARTYWLLGDFYTEEGQYAQAEKAYRKSISTGAKQFSANELDEAKNKLVVLLIAMKKYKEAEKWLDGMKKADNSSRPTLGFEDILCSRACIAISKRDYATARKLWQEAYTRYLKLLEPTDFYRRNTISGFLTGFSGIAVCYQRQNETDESLLVFNRMKECIISTFGRYIPYYIEQDRSNLLQLFQPWYEAMQLFAYRHIKHPGMPEFMYSNAQMMKQFFLASPSAYSAKRITLQDNEYMQQMNQRQQALMLTEDAMNVHLQGDYLPAILSNVRCMALNREAMNYVMEVVNEAYNCHTEWKTIRESLYDPEVMIEFILLQRPDNGARQYAALIFSKTNQSPHFVPLCDEKALRAVVNDLDKRDEFVLENIWEPLVPYFGDKVYLSIYPTGLLNTFSFAGIPDRDNRYLCNTYVLGYHLSAIDRILKCTTATPENKSIVLFGGADYGLPPPKQENPVRGQGFHYLPSSQKEVAAISNILKKKGCNVQVFSRKEATESAFRSLSLCKESPFILHISTHGFYLPYDPKILNKGLNQEGKSGYYDPLLRTGLALSGASRAWKDSSSLNLPNDGIITAYEILGMRLMNTELVVLSACNTGLGEIHDGEGVFGLQRAFRSAGARNMIVSLAEVPDKETAEFMSLFYQNWKGGESKHSAFLKAQWEMMKKYTKEPEKWANFVLIE